MFDDVQKMLNAAGRILAKIFTGKELKQEMAEQIQLMDSEDILAIAEGLLDEKRFSYCEDFMFFAIARNYSSELYNMGEHLAERIASIDKQILLDNDYSIEEANGWLADWQKYKTTTNLDDKAAN